MPSRLLATAACAALLAAATACGGGDGDAAQPGTTTATTAADAPVAGAPAEHSETVAEFLQSRGITATAVPADDASAPAVEVTVPDGWAVAEPGDVVELAGLLPAQPAAQVVALGADWAKGGALTPQAVLTVDRLSAAVAPDELLSRAPGALENLPLFEYGPESYDDVAGHPAYGLTGAYRHDTHGYLGVSQTTLLVDQHLVQLTVVWPTAAGPALAPTLREMNQSLTLVR